MSSKNGRSDRMQQAKRTLQIYLWIQTLGVIAWWALLFGYPPAVKWFQPASFPEAALTSFWLPDFVCIVTGGAFTLWAIHRQPAVVTPLLWAVTAAVFYPTLYCLFVSLMTDEGWLASAVMSLMSGAMLTLLLIQGVGDQQMAAFRPARLTARQALLWTLLQMALFWGLFLYVIPQAIDEVAIQLGWQRFEHVGQPLLAIALFVAASSIGLRSAYHMSMVGKGTPLPTATPPRLIVRGPYRYVRNPMAIAGIAQGIAVGWYLGSPWVICYAMLGAILWHLLVRPVEEHDLEKRFGDAYTRYRCRVPVWIPRGWRSGKES